LVRLGNPAASWAARLDVICSLLGVLLGAVLLLWPQLLVSLLLIHLLIYVLLAHRISVRFALLRVSWSRISRACWARP